MSYTSDTDLNIGDTPDVEDFDSLYADLLDLRNAVQILLINQDTVTNQNREFSSPIVTGDYTVLITDGTVRVDATSGDITITMPLSTAGVGYMYNIKRIDLVTANKVTIVGSGGELIDSKAAGINLSTESNLSVQAVTAGYDIT